MKAGYRQIMSRDLPERLQQGAILVDIRRQEEWQQTGIVAGSRLLTFYDAQGKSDPERWLNDLNRIAPLERPLLLICRTGQRTIDVCEFLTAVADRRQIYNVTDGIFGWLAAGLPVVPWR